MAFGGSQTNNQAWTQAAQLPRFLLSTRSANEFMIENIPKNNLAFRWIGRNTLMEQRCIEDIGIFSRGQGNGEPWQGQGDRIIKHLHEEKLNFQSEYLSLSTSPQRIVNFMVGARNSADGEVAVINVDTLNIMQRPHMSTIDLKEICGFRTGRNEEGRTKYVTETHLLVYEFIPASCILGYVDADIFRQICISQNITAQSDPEGKKKLDWASLRDFVSTRSRFSIDPQFGAPVQPQVAAFPITPPGTGQPHRVNQHAFAEIRQRQQAPSPTPSPYRRNGSREEDRNFVDLTMIEDDDPYI